MNTDKLTMVSVYANGKRKTMFISLPTLDGKPVLTDNILNTHFSELNIRRGDTYTVGK